MQRAYRLGLTGGIGSGKSTVAQILASAGAAIMDADAIARSITAPHGAAIAPIAEAFGPQAIGADGALDRAYMRQLVFQDATARQRLEAITHPLIAQLTEQQALQAQQLGARLLVFDVPLLVESGRWRQQLDAVLVVDCEPETQIQRVMARNGLERTAVEKILAAQARRQQRMAAADYVIYNDGIDLAALRTEVLSISAWLPL
ncbi:dephospho-CoA kinase [Comamonas kerstersii]|uniref:Dephospho-CoA kinase n=1 Tax=Comamonas kerstersii TaxID=225992 RepID=A0A1V0BE52_9BURK|nr:dephospho-CoA kinase [Comamonas kerstersii]AQZ98216.1 dephospho-CoA kinase [Comamonas kerstersii]